MDYKVESKKLKYRKNWNKIHKLFKKKSDQIGIEEVEKSFLSNKFIDVSKIENLLECLGFT